MTRDGVRQARAQHHELMLPLAFGRAHGAAYRAVETPQLALRAAIHIAHAADDGVCLIIEIETIADEFLELDFGRAFESAVAAISAAAITAIATRPPGSPISTRAIASRTAAAPTAPPPPP